MPCSHIFSSLNTIWWTTKHGIGLMAKCMKGVAHFNPVQVPLRTCQLNWAIPWVKALQLWPFHLLKAYFIQYYNIQCDLFLKKTRRMLLEENLVAIVEARTIFTLKKLRWTVSDLDRTKQLLHLFHSKMPKTTSGSLHQIAKIY